MNFIDIIPFLCLTIVSVTLVIISKKFHLLQKSHKKLRLEHDKMFNDYCNMVHLKTIAT